MYLKVFFSQCIPALWRNLHSKDPPRGERMTSAPWTAPSRWTETALISSIPGSAAAWLVMGNTWQQWANQASASYRDLPLPISNHRLVYKDAALGSGSYINVAAYWRQRPACKQIFDYVGAPFFSVKYIYFSFFSHENRISYIYYSDLIWIQRRVQIVGHL